MKQKNLIGLTLPALLCTLLWGSAFPAVKSGYALFGIGDEAACKLFFAGWRFMLAGVAVLVISVITSRKLVVPTRAQWPGILLLGLVQTTVQYVLDCRTQPASRARSFLRWRRFSPWASRTVCLPMTGSICRRPWDACSDLPAC